MYVVYHSSDGFVDVTAVSIISLLENNKDCEFIKIYYINRDISDKNKKILCKMVNNYAAEIEFIDMPNWSEKFNINLSTTLKRWLGFGYNRLFITELLPHDVDRVIYLDSDTIIEGSLDELWNLDMEKYYMAGVDDCLSKRYRKMVHLNDNGVYCNSGVLVLNLKKFRDENVVERFLGFISKHNGFFVYNEQTILNAVFENNIKILPIKYNVYTMIYTFTYNQILKLRKPLKYSYSEKDYNDAKKNPIITHYTGCFAVASRPWIKGSDHPHVGSYIKYRALTPWGDEDLKTAKFSISEKICNFIIKIIPMDITIFIAGILYKYLRPFMFCIRKKKHLKGIKD